MFTESLHLFSLALYLGFVAALSGIMLPAVTSIGSHAEGTGFLVRALRIYNPTQIAALGVLVITGASQITDLKEIYRESYAAEFGGILGVKLLMSFIIIMLGTYQCLGVGHRFVRLYEAEPENASERMPSVVKKLHAASILIIPCMLYTVYLGLSL